jgi:hypothetical protein
MRMSAVLLAALFGCTVVHAAPPCQDMADKVSKKFDAERKMSSVNQSAKCTALSLVISDLTDLALACAADEKFREETYMPLAKAIGEEAPKACPK